MKIQKQTYALIACTVLLSQLFIACKKSNDTSNSNIHATSVDNSIHNLPVDSSLVLWLTFRNGSLKDKSEQHNDVIFSSATLITGKQGIDSTAFLFDGASSYMLIKHNASLNPVRNITLAALVKPMGFYQGSCHQNRIISKGVSDGEHGRYILGFDDNAYYNYEGCGEPVKKNRENFFATYGNGNDKAISTRDNNYVKAGNWYNLVYTYNGSVSNLYINNKLVNSSERSVSFKPNGSKLYIGKAANMAYNYYFNGVIDEIRIYNRALSANEVINLDNVMGKDN